MARRPEFYHDGANYRNRLRAMLTSPDLPGEV